MSINDGCNFSSSIHSRCKTLHSHKGLIEIINRSIGLRKHRFLKGSFEAILEHIYCILVESSLLYILQIMQFLTNTTCRSCYGNISLHNCFNIPLLRKFCKTWFHNHSKSYIFIKLYRAKD